MPKKDVRARNWRNYNEALVKRGSITFWFSQEMIDRWHDNDSLNRRGRPRKYSDVAVRCGLTLKAIFHLTFRATEGFIKSLIEQLKIKAEVPDYSSLCKRQKKLSIKLPGKEVKQGEQVHILVDTTGLKIIGEGEWKVRQHGYVRKRIWRKLHLAINEKSQEVEAFQLTDLGIQDGEGLPMLLNEISKKVCGVKGDGAYDKYEGYKLGWEKKFKLITPPRRDAKLTKECRSKSVLRKHTLGMLKALKRRDHYIKQIREVGLKKWKEEMGYHRRSLAETAMFRMKTLFGNKLKNKLMENQIVEAGIRCLALNKITSLGFGWSTK